jgi:hypothetical protein
MTGLMLTLKIFFTSLIIFTAISFPQTERYTKGAENGYSWLAMDDPNLMYSTSKENYLSSILERLSVTGEKYPEIASLSCKEDIIKLLSKGKSDKFSLEDVVKKIDGFYSREENLVIPIIFAYCYTIKQFAGASSKELNAYKEEVLKFCNK